MDNKQLQSTSGSYGVWGRDEICTWLAVTLNLLPGSILWWPSLAHRKRLFKNVIAADRNETMSAFTEQITRPLHCYTAPFSWQRSTKKKKQKRQANSNLVKEASDIRGLLQSLPYSPCLEVGRVHSRICVWLGAVYTQTHNAYIAGSSVALQTPRGEVFLWYRFLWVRLQSNCPFVLLLVIESKIWRKRMSLIFVFAAFN